MNDTRMKDSGRDHLPEVCKGSFTLAAFVGLAVRWARAGSPLFAGTLVVVGALLATPKVAAAQGFHIYIPSISTPGVDPVGAGERSVDCGLNTQEQRVAELMANDPNQARSNPVCDATLSQVARARARDMALRGYFSHTNPDGNGPNLLVRQAGYPLPDWYSSDPDSNNIESIGGGYESASAVWQGWLGSQSHRTHVLGTHSFYANQNAYGVGYYHNADAPLKHYWVFLSAPLPE